MRLSGKLERRGNASAVTGRRVRGGHWVGRVAVVFWIAGGGHGWASQATLAEAPTEVREAAEDNAVGFLNDLSSRRRTTTFFMNPQPVFAGVQESFVNTSTGALTFLVRDLVRIGGMPIVLGRVYDSTLDEGADFGPGWKLTVVEEIRQEGSQLVFTDASNGEHRLDVSGGSVTPTSSATAPVVSGSTRTTRGEAGIVVLESADGMLRGFKQDGEVWRLVHVWHGRGWVRLDWRRGALVEVTSDAGWVRISRRDDGRIASIVDDLGRTVAYSYDPDGRLTGVADRAGGQWRMGYAGAGRLSSITDPRSKVVLAAAWTEARVRRIRVLHETTDFSYTDTATTATNLLGWATVYRRDDSGITTSITDRTGATTEVAFDSQHRPVTVTRDGATITRVGYDEDGHLISLWQPVGETAFTTNNRGEVTVATGVWTARYRYGERRVVHASDSGGVRDYRYDEDGTPAYVTVDGIDTALRTNADGTLAGLSREGRSLTTYSYAAGGRISSIDYGGDTTATFVYDARGLRTSGSYTYGSDNRIDAEMSYDAAGNLTRIERGIAGGEATEQAYVVGDYNEVLQVRTGNGQDPDRPDLSFEYDAVGRMQRATLGGRTATVEYDALDRTTQLVVDGDIVLEHAYGPDDGDAATRQDLRTGGVLVAERLSPVFGTMESIVYARPRSAEFGIVAYSPTRKSFEVRPDALAADGLLLASLHARMVPLGGQQPNAAPFGHDKPSNSLFIPPEFKAVNCQLCDSSVLSVELSVEPAGTHCPTNFTGTVDGSCAIVPPWDSPIVFPIVLPWFHTTYFGDGSSASETTWDGEVSGSHKYLLAREYTMSHFVVCPCPSAFAVGSDSVTFEVSGSNSVPRVSIQSASIPDNQISLTLVGPGCSGDLHVRVTGDGVAHNVATVAQASPGNHTLSFGRDLIPKGQYEKVEATWRIRDGLTADDEYDYSFGALGSYRHTQYTKPNQAHPTCATGPLAEVFITEEDKNGNTDCFDDESEYTATTFRDRFRGEVEENGSGRTPAFGDIQLEWACESANPRPVAATFGNVFRDIKVIKPACEDGTLGSSTVAVYDMNPDMTCGDRIYVSGVGVKTVTDHCPGCRMARVDHYVADGRCSGILDLAESRRTFRLDD